MAAPALAAEAKSLSNGATVRNSLLPGGPDVRLLGTPVLTDSGREPVARVTVLVGTKRPGGLDAILHSLAQQTRKDFELVVVDELWEREPALRAAAHRLGLRLAAVSASKPKASSSAFGFQVCER